MLLPLAVLIFWPGAGHSTASPWLVHGIALAVTVPFAIWLLWSTRRRPPRGPHLVLFLAATLLLQPAMASDTYLGQGTLAGAADAGAGCRALRPAP